MGQKLILFGASKLGILAFEYLKDKNDIQYFCDNDVTKIGKRLSGLEIISVEKLIDLVINEDFIVMISSHYYKEIGEQLLIAGINKKKIKVFLNSLEYLQTIYDLDEKKERMKNVEGIEYNKSIFSKYNVHLMEDNIFINAFIENINKNYNRNENIFIIYTNGGDSKHIDASKYNNIKIIDLKDNSIYNELYVYIYGCNKLFIHFLTDEICKILDKVCISKLSCKKYWVLYGADLYDYIDFNMYEERTYEFIKNKEYFLNYERYRGKTNELDIRKRIIGCIDYILTYNKGDYQLVIDNFETNAKQIEFSYIKNIPFEKLNIIKESKDFSFKNKSGFKYLFLIGNSATFTNNHLDVFWRIKELGIEDYGIVLPCSYGYKDYAKDIINEGKKLLGDRFIILEDFINPYEYHKILNQVDVVIMNHIRQQGGGNISAAVYLNKPVFLNPKSSLYKLYIEKNLKVYSINELDKHSLVIDNPDNKIQPEILEKIFFTDYKELLS